MHSKNFTYELSKHQEFEIFTNFMFNRIGLTAAGVVSDVFATGVRRSIVVKNTLPNNRISVISCQWGQIIFEALKIPFDTDGPRRTIQNGRRTDSRNIV